ncbi:MAG: sigma 54-interacting transcriptional regulator [Planctomycetes bacterium]|nr:sigma 54-interacting transcriptional regulator [Planctomycetota bacterium]
MPKRTRTTRRLEVWLKGTDLALFVLNAQRRLVFFNRGSERLTGWSAPDLLGQKCDYVTEPDINSPAALLAALAPPPEAWKGSLEQVPGNIPRRTDSPLSRVVYYFPLVDPDQEVQAMLGIIADIPETPGSRPIPAAQRLHAELAVLRQTVRRQYGDGGLIGRSLPMQRAFEQIKLAQSAMTAVLFVGEAGTGKQHLARILHYHGPHGKKAFVPLDCRLPSRELEQTLIRIREDQQADSLRTGAVYLDHIDAAPAEFQRSLLDWLKAPTSNPVRVLAGTTHPLLPGVEAERFSRELYFALSALVVELPPLRERMEDLEPLAQHFLEESNREVSEQVGGLSEEVWRQFRRYNWPGNVGELRRVITEARSGGSGTLVAAEQLPFRFRTGVTAQSMEPTTRPRIVSLDQFLEQVEREQIEGALTECRGNKARAAEFLGITRPRLYRRMEVLGIADPDPTETPPKP